MKKLLLPIIFFALSLSLQAQVVNDSVQMGADYPNQVYYQLEMQTKTPVPFAGSGGWDIGFQTTLMNASIISDENTILVYKAPNADSSQYATLDTAGYASWPQLYNSDTTWDKGAFNMQADLSNPFDFGWGIYDFNTHAVYGDSLFVVEKGNDLYKLWIRKKTAAGDYIIRYANITSGGADIDLTIPAAAYSSKNFVYLNLENPATIDPEPVSIEWDILFTRYYTYIPFPGVYYPVIGVFSNTGVTAAKAYPVDVSTVSYTDYTGMLSPNLSAIGWDWKVFDMYIFQYYIVDSLIYFIKGKNNNIYSLRFTGFDDNTGTISFQTENFLTSVDEMNHDISQAVVYPNPSGTQTTIVYDAKTNAKVDAQLFDVSGRKVMQTFFVARQGLNHETISLPALSQGIYQLVLNTGTQKLNLKVVVAQ